MFSYMKTDSFVNIHNQSNYYVNCLRSLVKIRVQSLVKISIVLHSEFGTTQISRVEIDLKKGIQRRVYVHIGRIHCIFFGHISIYLARDLFAHPKSEDSEGGGGSYEWS